MKTKHKIYLLIGPKGSGKTYIGKLMETHFNIKFFRVEDVWLKLKEEKKYLSQEEYFQNIDEFCKEGNIVIINKIKELLKSKDSIVIESLGVAPHFSSFLEGLNKISEVVLIKISSNYNLCLERIKTRDQSIHISISDDKLKLINEKVSQIKMDYAFEIFNENITEQDILTLLKEKISS